MKVSKRFLEDLKIIRNDIKCVWNDILERFQIIHIDKRTGLQRILLTVENEDGTFRPLDMRSIIYVANNIAWDMIDKYPNPKEMWGEFLKDKNAKKIKRKKLREEYRKWWNKDHRLWWKKALENFSRGIIDEAPAERKIIIT